MCTGNLPDPANLFNEDGLGLPDPIDAHPDESPSQKAGAAAAAAVAAYQAAQEAAKAPGPAARKRVPDQAALRAGAAAMQGPGSATMLTGPGGVAPNLLSVGKNSLLGA